MPNRQADFECLVDQIYEAAIYPDKWGSTLHNLSMASHAAGGIILLRRSNDWIGWRSSDGMRGAKAFMESDAPARSKNTERLLACDRPGFVSDTDLFTDEEYRADSLVAEWAAPNQLHHAAATAIKPPSADLVVVHVQRSVGDPGSGNGTRLVRGRIHLALDHTHWRQAGAGRRTIARVVRSNTGGG